MKIHSKMMRFLQTLPLAFSLFLAACGSDVTSSSTSSNDATTSNGTSASAGSASTFACSRSISPPVMCKLGVEYCKIQDSAGPTVYTCLPIPQVCSSGDLCACAENRPGCALGDGPGAYTCGKDSGGSYFIACFG